MTLPSLPVVLQVAPAIVSGAVALAASPILWSRTQLVLALRAKEAQNLQLVRQIEALGAGSEGLAAIAEQVGALGRRVEELQHELTSARAELADLKRVNVLALQHISRLITHVRSRKPGAEMPPLPPELEAALAELHAQDERASEAGATA